MMQYRKKQKRKVSYFMVSVAMSVVFLIVGILGQLMSNLEEKNSYEAYMLQADTASEPEEQMENYIKAYGYWVVTHGLDTEGIPIPTYETDGSFDYCRQESEFFAEYFSAHMVYNEEVIGSISEEKYLLDISAEYADELVQYIYSNLTE